MSVIYTVLVEDADLHCIHESTDIIYGIQHQRTPCTAGKTLTNPLRLKKNLDHREAAQTSMLNELNKSMRHGRETLGLSQNDHTAAAYYAEHSPRP